MSGTELTRFNALRHGVLSQHTVLPWENDAEYLDLLEALVTEHSPVGPTEEHLIEELAGVLWRKRRLRMAEATACRHGLAQTLEVFSDSAETALVHLHAVARFNDLSEAVRSKPEDDIAELDDLLEHEAMTKSALEYLKSKSSDAYKCALRELREDTLNWWNEELSEHTSGGPVSGNPHAQGLHYTASIEGLGEFLENEVIPWIERRRAGLTIRPQLRTHAFGEAIDVDRLDRLVRYEVFLDRKLERMLSMLLRLRDVRASEGNT